MQLRFGRAEQPYVSENVEEIIQLYIWLYNTRPLRMPGNKTPLAYIVMQWPWQDNATAEACVNYLET